MPSSDADYTVRIVDANGDPDWTVAVIDGISDLNPTSGDLLQFNGTAWVNKTITGAGIQPLDSDLTAIAALTTTAYGRALLTLADATAGRTALGLGTAATQATTAFDAAGAAAAAQAASQPVDSDLTAIAALTTTAYGRAFLALADAAAARTAIGVASPGLVCPPVSFANGSAAVAAWPASNRALFSRFYLPVDTTLRWMLFNIGNASGNIQYGVIHLTGGTGNLNFTRVMDSGVIACPTAGDQRRDLGATALSAGDYMAFLWADNTSVTMPNSNYPASAVPLRVGAVYSTLVSGVPANGALPDWSNPGKFTTVALEGNFA